MAGKDMPSLEVRAGRGGRPPLSSRDRELGRDGSSGAILCLSASRANGRRLFLNLAAMQQGMHWDLRGGVRTDRNAIRT